MKVCTECNKKLGFWSPKYKRGNDTTLCSICFENWKKQLKENDKKIMTEYIIKYLSGKDMENNALVLAWNKDKNIRNLFDKNSLEKVTNHFETLLLQIENSNKSGMSSFEIDEIIESKESYGMVLNFLDDLEKMYKLFKRKNVITNYNEILSIFAEICKQNMNKEYDKLIEPVYIRISKRISSDAGAEEIIKEFANTPLDIELNFENVSRLLEKFNLEYNENEIEKIINDVLEELEIDAFEHDFGSVEVEISDFEGLTGYEFESYLENIFTLLGYTVIQTSLSGDQGADLIISKDGEKSVVQAKKYTGKVSNGAIQEIVAAKNHYNAQNAIVVTNSFFTKSAIDLALSNDVELWDGLKLENIVQDLNSKKKKEKQIPDKSYTIKGKGIQKIKIECPFCDEEVECDIDSSTISDFKIMCPSCGLDIQAEAASTTWNCEYCSKQFNTKK